MMIAARTSFLMGAKPYDAEVEYIESTGTQYIDTGYVLVPTTRLIVSGKWTYRAMSTTDAQQMGIIKSTDTAQYRTVLANQSGYLQIYSATANPQISSSGLPDITYIVDFPNLVCSVNGVSASISSASLTGSFTRPFYLCARCEDAGAPGLFCQFRIYAASFLTAGLLIHDFIPVRVGSGSAAVGYLYDRANPTGGPNGNGLYGNSGTGAFTIGPDKA